jgi:hypothetical protein
LEPFTTNIKSTENPVVWNNACSFDVVCSQGSMMFLESTMSFKDSPLFGAYRIHINIQSVLFLRFFSSIHSSTFHGCLWPQITQEVIFLSLCAFKRNLLNYWCVFPCLFLNSTKGTRITYLISIPFIKTFSHFLTSITYKRILFHWTCSWDTSSSPTASNLTPINFHTSVFLQAVGLVFHSLYAVW